jgi:predicted esterase YcpF (UPF0227 family)
MIYTGMDDDEFEHVEKIRKEEYNETVKRLKEDGDEISKFREEQAIQQASTEKVDDGEELVKAKGQ